MAHGGPDSKGLYVSSDEKVIFGHRRLSLIDLSPSGHQPMSYMSRYSITYNGEIYNYKQLRSELQLLGYDFHSSADTEVILAAFAEWDVGSFSKLKGMYAFAIHDSQKNEVILARDPVGIKPLYYQYDGLSLSFASETRAFKAFDNQIVESPEWPVLLLAYGHIPEPYTIYKNVKSLPKGSFIRYDLAKTSFSISSFRHFSFAEDFIPVDGFHSVVRTELEKAIESHMISDAPLGVFLSGGLDSSIITKVASRKSGSRLNTLSLFFNETKFSEKYYQDLLLRELDVNRNQILLDFEGFDQALPSVLHSMDQPSCDGINTWFISKNAKDLGLKAVLSGIGADELFGGYPSFGRMQMTRMLSSLPDSLLWAGNKTSYKPLKRAAYLGMEGMGGIYLFLRGYLSIHEISIQLDSSEKEILHMLESASTHQDVSGLDHRNQASWMEFHLYLQNQLLRDADVMGMAHGVEIRVPFLDSDLIELTFNCHPDHKFDRQRSKKLLVDAFSDQLPEPIWNRNKMGFSFPFTQWFSSSSYVKEQMLSGNVVTRNRYNAFMDGRSHWSHILALLLLRQHNHA